MSTDGPTRRLFFWGAGGALSASLAAGAAAAAHDDPLRARLALLEDMSAVRELREAFVRHLNAGRRAEAAALFADPGKVQLDAGVTRLSSDLLAEAETIAIAEDGATAVARLPCTAHRETPIEPRCTLVDMARAQGGGVVRRAEPCVLELAFTKSGGVWAIARAELGEG